MCQGACQGVLAAVRVPKQLLEEIESWIVHRKFGSLQINFQDGKIVNLNKVESVKVSMLAGAEMVGSISVTQITNTPMLK